MRKKGRWVALFALLVLVSGFALCLWEEEDDEGPAPGLLGLARLVDYQLGEVSDGTAATCGRTVSDVGKHCKNKMNGDTGKSMVVQYVELIEDQLLIQGSTVHPFSGTTVFWERAELLSRNMCSRDENPQDGVPDHEQICSGGTVECRELDANSYQLTYINCTWQESGPNLWLVDGKVRIDTSVSSENEQLVVRTFSDFYTQRVSDSAYYIIDGRVINYTRLDPFSGQPLEGAVPGTTVADGMTIVLLDRVTIDVDGPGAGATVTDYPFGLRFAVDNEDGLVFLSGSAAVWLGSVDFPVPGSGAGRRLHFYDRDNLWNILNAGGCMVDVTSIDPLNRTFTLTSPDNNDPCVVDDNTVEY